MLKTVRPIVQALRDPVLHLAVTLMVQDRTDRTVDRQFLPVDSKARDLGVEVREVPPLE